MNPSLRNALATVAAFAMLMLSFDYLDRLFSRTVIPDCIIYVGHMPWRYPAYSIVPLLAASLFAGGTFAVLSRESTSRSAGLVGGLILMTSAIPTPASYLSSPAWWCTLTWLLALIAVVLGVLAGRMAQARVLKWRAT